MSVYNSEARTEEFDDVEEPAIEAPAFGAPVAEGQFVGAAAELPAAARLAVEDPATEGPAADITASDAPVIDAPAADATAPPTGREPLLTEKAIEELLNRWDEIQISFVDAPRSSVQGADTLIRDIGATFEAALRERRNRLAEDWQGSSDTEKLRCALTQYRSLVGVLLPK